MRQPDVHGAKRFIRPVTYGILFGAGACFLLLLIMSAVMGLRDIPQSAVSLIATLIFVLGGFVAGYVSAAFAREKGMLLGLCCGACLFVILSLASLAVDGGRVRHGGAHKAGRGFARGGARRHHRRQPA